MQDSVEGGGEADVDRTVGAIGETAEVGLGMVSPAKTSVEKCSLIGEPWCWVDGLW